MRQRTICLLASLICLGIQRPVSAQQDQYEFGRRIGAFELAWEKVTDTQPRKRALAILRPATIQMLTTQFGEASRLFDEARYALAESKGPSPASLWADSLCVRLDTRLIDASETALPFTVQPFYKPKAPPVADAKLGMQVLAGLGGKLHQVPITKMPLEGTLPLAGTREGDHMLHITFRVDDKVVSQTLFKFSVVKDLKPRLEKLKQAVTAFGNSRGTLDQESVREIYETLVALDKKQTRESDYPAARLLAEAEAAVVAINAGKTFYGSDKTGQFWLRLPNGPGTLPVRLLAPDAVKENKPLPLVIAMHGIAGSENLFFEGFGVGTTVKLCNERGWLLVAPHNGLLGKYSPEDVINEVAKLYPVDKSKVFVIGHSLGAKQAVTAALQNPTRIAGVAALGGGNERITADIRQVAFFVGAGTSDIAVLSARGLRDNLRKAGVKTVEYREYPDFEHYVIVREALPDVFAMFDRIVGPASRRSNQ